MNSFTYTHAVSHLDPQVHVGLHGRIHITFGANAPTVVGSANDMRVLAYAIISACCAGERGLGGDIQFSNEDIHPAANFGPTGDQTR